MSWFLTSCTGTFWFVSLAPSEVSARSLERDGPVWSVCMCGWKRLWLWGGGRIAVLDKEEKLEELFPPSRMVSFALLSVILECHSSYCRGKRPRNLDKLSWSCKSQFGAHEAAAER